MHARTSRVGFMFLFLLLLYDQRGFDRQATAYGYCSCSCYCSVHVSCSCSCFCSCSCSCSRESAQPLLKVRAFGLVCACQPSQFVGRSVAPLFLCKRNSKGGRRVSWASLVNRALTGIPPSTGLRFFCSFTRA